MIRNQLEITGAPFIKKWAFKANKSTKAITKRMRMKVFSKVAIIDSPGFNDPEKERSDV